MLMNTAILICNQSIPFPSFDFNISHLGIDTIYMKHLDVSKITLNQSFQSVFNIFVGMFVLLLLQMISVFYLVYYTRKNQTKQPTRKHHSDPCLLKLDDE